MYLREFHLTNFRNFTDLSVSFAPGAHVIFGNNGVGKTNFLEAVYYLAIGRSHRRRKDAELVRFNSDFFRITATAARNGDSSDFEVTYSKSQTPNKRIMVDGSALDRVSTLVGEFKAVILSFDDLTLVSGPPHHRRRFLNILLSEISPAYLSDIISYRRVLQQRNRLLWEMKTEMSRDLELLESWDDQLVQLGSRIVSKRREVSGTLFDEIGRIYASLGVGSQVQLSYVPSFEVSDVVESDFLGELHRRRQTEILRGQTLVGPHRDEIEILLDGVNLRQFGSCGQQRLVAVAMRFGEASLLNGTEKDSPVLMLDEILVELDPRTRAKVLDHLRSYEQVFIASASPLELEGSDVVYYTLKDQVLKWNE
jgi:DNA replication and repair protein RecF